jgi:5-methylcytosine-specific restriction endonuclease McrA
VPATFTPWLTEGCAQPAVPGRGHCKSHLPKKGGRPWRRIRDQVLQDAGYRCHVPGCTNVANEVDHIVPRIERGTDDLSNLRPSCKAHNVGRTSRRGRYAVPPHQQRRRPPPR